jgi:hypothetical protein
LAAGTAARQSGCLRAARPGDGVFRPRQGHLAITPEQREEKKLDSQQRYAEVSEEIHAISQLLRAYSLYERDVEYVVRTARC